MAEELGLPLMPWQQMVVDVGLELLPNGVPAYREVIISVPRQSGKTQELLAVELHRALMWKRQPQRIYYSAQTGSDAGKKLLDDQVPMVESSPINLLVRRVYRAMGSECIVFVNGSRIDVTASGEAAGHGTTVDLGVIDEAFADQDDRREQAAKPAMATRPDAQLWIASTAGTEQSSYLKRKVDSGRASVVDGYTQGIAYFEYSAEPEADIGDHKVWRRCMPALGHTITEEVVEHEFKTMPELEFRRAFLNQWTVSEERVIPASLWNEVSKIDVVPAEKGLTFAIDVAADRTKAAIVAIDNEHKAELIDYRPGVAWLAPRAAELANKWIAPVALDLKGPAGNIVQELELRGVHVVKYDASEMAGATARLYDAIADRKIRIRSNPDLNKAVAGARKRVVGDRWVWARRDAYVDISPLVALTLAYDASVNIARQGGTLWASWG